MSRSRAKLALAGALACCALALAIPVFGEKKPQSLLPPGFGQAPPVPAEEEPKPDQADHKPGDLVDDLKLNTPDQNAVSAEVKHVARAPTEPTADDLGNAVAAVDDNSAEPPAAYDMPPKARRSLAQIGVLTPESQGLGLNAFGTVDGKVLEKMMRLTTAPIASRWVSIVLRRALLSDVATPPRVNGADWVAERAWLLLRMGEAESSRLLIQQVDHDNYTPKLFTVAMQSALANADMASICPLVPAARKVTDEPAWQFGRAICASLSGEAGSASSFLREAESDTEIRGIDSRLAERIIGAGKNTRHAVIIEWDNVYRLNAWRFGMATSVGLPIPAKLYGTVRPNVRAWAARAPMLKLADRADAADWAAVLGVYSNEALVSFYSALADQSEARRDDTSVPTLLQKAYVAATTEARASAMHALWTPPNADIFQQYARLILTARAAARLPVDPALAKYCDAFAASMLTAGLDVQAQRWSKIASDGSDDAARRAWGLLAVGSPAQSVDVSEQRINAYRSTGDLRSRFLVAALAGLGRIKPGEAGRLAGDFNVAIGARTPWSHAIDAAARRHEPGTVALLAAVGMPSLSWSNISPETLFHVVSALKQVGLEPEARMVAAEALTRV